MEFRTIPNYDGRYVINEEGIVLDLRPERSDSQWFYNVEPREISTKGGKLSLYLNHKEYRKTVVSLLREVFPDYFIVTERQLEKIKQRIETQDSIQYTVEEFNKLIWPNKVICIYDKTYNEAGYINPKDRRKNLWRKPNKVSIRNERILLKKGHTYFGVGRSHLIKFDGLIPYNGKPMQEPDSKNFMRKYRQNDEKKQTHITELW